MCYHNIEIYLEEAACVFNDLYRSHQSKDGDLGSAFVSTVISLLIPKIIENILPIRQTVGFPRAEYFSLMCNCCYDCNYTYICICIYSTLRCEHFEADKI
jgi:hypothetical protein